MGRGREIGDHGILSEQPLNRKKPHHQSKTLGARIDLRSILALHFGRWSEAKDTRGPSGSIPSWQRLRLSQNPRPPHSAVETVEPYPECRWPVPHGHAPPHPATATNADHVPPIPHINHMPSHSATKTMVPYPKCLRPVPHGHAPPHPATATNAQPRAAPFRHANDSVVPQTSTCRPSPVPRVNNDAIKNRSAVAYFSYLCCLSMRRASHHSFIRDLFSDLLDLCCAVICGGRGAGSGERGVGGWLSDRANWRLKPVGKKRTIRVS